MAETIEITKEDIEKLKNQLETAGEEFKTNYNKLTALIEQIRRGDFTGEAADLFLQKYEEKKDFLSAMRKENQIRSLTIGYDLDTDFSKETKQKKLDEDSTKGSDRNSIADVISKYRGIKRD